MFDEDQHYTPDGDEPQTREQVMELNDMELFGFAGKCPVEPADFDDCLACFALLVLHVRRAPGFDGALDATCRSLGLSFMAVRAVRPRHPSHQGPATPGYEDVPVRPPVPPWFAAAHKNKLTCAHPGSCGLAGTVDIEVAEGILLEFCETHAAEREVAAAV